MNLKKIDELALQNNWWSKNSQIRYDYISLNFIQELCKNEGHVFFSYEDIRGYFNNYDSYKNVELDNIINSLEPSKGEGYIFTDKKYYYYKEYYDMEQEILKILKKYKSTELQNTTLTKEEILKKMNVDGNEKIISDEQVSKY